MSRATADLVDAIHGLVAASFLDRLKKAKEEPLTPQEFAQITKFLKDNGVDAPATAARVDTLANELRDLDLETEAMSLRH